MRTHAMLAVAVTACGSSERPSPQAEPTRGSDASARPPAVDVAAREAKLERKTFPELGVSMLVPPAVEAKAVRDADRSSIQLTYDRAWEDGGAFVIQLATAYDFERAELTAARHKTWLFEHSERKDIAIILEAKDALVYEATEEGVGRTCATWAIRELGTQLWHVEAEETTIETSEAGRRRYRLPAGTCLDLVAMIRSLRESR